MSKTVIVGVTGSVAAYRAADVCRELMRNGIRVRVCLTRSAEQFVTRSLFEALTGEPAVTDVFDEPERGRMAHIDWAREASCILICPATANALATLAAGQAGDMLSTIVAATTAPVVLAPAMNPDMYASEANLANMRTLEARGATFVQPEEGDVACGENGQGKLASNARIVAAVLEASFESSLLEGRHVLITSGPTREPIDPVRFLSNRSSGRMGQALARAAIRMGATATLVTGPATVTPPPRARIVRVETANEMLQATLSAAESADLLVAAAAVADFRPTEASSEKIKGKTAFDLRLEPNPDIIGAVRNAHPGLPIIGFAAETDRPIEHARQKLAGKSLQAIVVNDVSRSDIGFDSEENEGVMLLADGGEVPLPKSSKFEIARSILETAVAFLQHC